MARRRPAVRTKHDVSDALVEGIFKGRDWSQLYVLIREGVRRRAFGAPTIVHFLSYAVHDEAVRTELRGAIVSGRSWRRRVAEKSPLSAAEVERTTDVGEVVREVRRLYGGDQEAAEKFLTRAHPRFGKRPPILVAASEGGAQAVRELLARMEEGAPV